MDKQEAENDLCRCCHTEGAFKSLYSSYFWMDIEEVVCINLLQECFDIEMTPVSEPLQSMLGAICETCIESLQGAVKFKRQVQKCERRFRQVYGSCVGEDTTPEVNIKQETEDDVEDDIVNMPLEIGLEEQNDKIPAVNNDVPTSSEMAKQFDILMDDNDEDGISDREELYDSSVHNVPRKKVYKNKNNPKALSIEENTTPKPKLADTDEDGKNNEAEEFGVIDDNTKAKIILKSNVHYKKTDTGFECLICHHVIPKTSHKNKIRISQHVKTVHMNIGKYKCPICNELFWDTPLFIKHKFEKHKIDDRIQCNACDKRLCSKMGLEQHVRAYHMMGKSAKCEICGFETYRASGMINHMKNHSDVKDYQCQYCHKKFKRKSTVQLHERIHTGVKNKVCTVCGQAFVQRASLKYHMLKYHPEVDF